MLSESLCIFKLCANDESWNQGVASQASRRDCTAPRVFRARVRKRRAHLATALYVPPTIVEACVTYLWIPGLYWRPLETRCRYSAATECADACQRRGI